METETVDVFCSRVRAITARRRRWYRSPLFIIPYLAAFLYWPLLLVVAALHLVWRQFVWRGIRKEIAAATRDCVESGVAPLGTLFVLLKNGIFSESDAAHIARQVKPGVTMCGLESEASAHINALHLAIKGGDIELAKLLIERGAKVDATNNEHETPLHLAVRQGRIELAKLLIERGANIDATNSEHDTPLHLAVVLGHVELAKLLIERDANVDATNGYQQTPLHFAVGQGYVELAKLLIERDAKVDATNSDHETPLHLAVGRDHVKLVKLLIERDANITAAGKYGNSPLHYAFMDHQCHLEAAELLLKAGVNVDVRNNRGWTPLHVASGTADPRGVSCLLQRGADARAASDDGTTPLHQSSALGHTEVMKLLLAAGAQVDARDAQGFTPLSAASSQGMDRAVSILRSHSTSTSRTKPESQKPIAARLRKEIHDFDTSQAEGIVKLRGLCEQDPEMKRVPEGIERSLFCEVEALKEVAKQFKEPPDYSRAAELWEANLDCEAKERKKREEASARPVDTKAVESFIAKLSDPDTDVIYEACRKLRDMGKHAFPALPKCIELLRHRDPALRQSAADTIAAIGKPAASASSALEDAKRRETEDWAKDSIVHALREIQR